MRSTMFSVPKERRKCETCGKLFRPNTRTQKYCCPECRVEPQKEMMRQRYVRIKKRGKNGVQSKL